MAGAGSTKLTWKSSRGTKNRRSEHSLPVQPCPLADVSNSGQPTLKDLCLADKLRVKQLIEDLARAGEEKEAVEEQLEAERRCFSGKLTALRRRQAALLRDKQTLEEKMKESHHILQELQARNSADKVPPLSAAGSCQLPATVPSTHKQLPFSVASQIPISVLAPVLPAPVREYVVPLQPLSVANPNQIQSQNVTPGPVYVPPRQGELRACEGPMFREQWCPADLPLAQSILPRLDHLCNLDSASSCSNTWCTLPEASLHCHPSQTSPVSPSNPQPVQDQSQLTAVDHMTSPPTSKGDNLAQLANSHTLVVPLTRQEVGIQTLSLHSIATQTEQPFSTVATNEDQRERQHLQLAIPQPTQVAVSMRHSTRAPSPHNIPTILPPVPSSVCDDSEMVSALLNDTESQEELIAGLWEGSHVECSYASYQLYSQEPGSPDSLYAITDVDHEDKLLEDLFFIQ